MPRISTIAICLLLTVGLVLMVNLKTEAAKTGEASAAKPDNTEPASPGDAKDAPPRSGPTVTSVPGSPGATTTIDGKHLPPGRRSSVVSSRRTPRSPSPGGRRAWCRPRARRTCCSS